MSVREWLYEARSRAKEISLSIEPKFLSIIVFISQLYYFCLTFTLILY